MEFNYWLKVSGIVVLVLGSIYFLLPTFLQEDGNTLLENAAKSVHTTEDGSVELTVVFAVEGGDAVAAAAALKVRLDEKGVPIEFVREREGQVEVGLKAGALRSDIVAEAGRPNVVRLVNASDLAKVPDPLPANAALLAKDPNFVSLRDRMVPEAVSAVPARLSVSQDATPAVLVEGDVGKGPFVVSLDNVVRAVAFVDAGPPQTLSYAGVGVPVDLVALVRAGGILARLTEVAEEPKAEKPKDQPAAEAPQGRVPAWLLSLLPDTRMPLGLDLMGGVDLTMQVQLDEALQSQVKRDASDIIKKAKEADLDFASVRVDYSRPVMWVRTDESLSAVTSFYSDYLNGYTYLEDRVDDGQTEHGYGLTEDRQADVQEKAMSQVLDQVRKRVADTKVRDPIVVKKGRGRISVQLPGLTKMDEAVSTIGTVAVLEFKLVDGKFPDTQAKKLVRAAEKAMPAEQFNNDALVNEWLWANKKLPEDRIIGFLYKEEVDAEGVAHEVRDKGSTIVMKSETLLTGNDVNSADVQFDPQNNEASVSLEFKPQGATTFCQLTSEHVREQFAIILDGHVRSAPQISEKICGGTAAIHLGRRVNGAQEAKVLATVLRSGALNAPVVIGDVRHLGPNLGADAIRGGILATLLGGVLVWIFMWVWYRTAGWVANFALVVNLLVMMAMLAVFGWTLTLAGICGMALAMGMAVDGNIIIYERIREELKVGQSARKAVDVGFNRAFTAILDAHVTAGISGVVLYSYGNALIESFAVTVMVGSATTLISSMFVSRTILEIMTRKNTARLKI